MATVREDCGRCHGSGSETLGVTARGLYTLANCLLCGGDGFLVVRDRPRVGKARRLLRHR
jgi:hypothetical protein